MSKRIMVVNPWGVDYMDDLTAQVVAPHASGDTDVVCTSLGSAVEPVPWPTPSGRGPMIEAALKAEASGFDALVIGCAADPFLDDTRAAVSIPVIGVTESVCQAAKKWGKLTIMARRLSDSYLPLIPSQGNWDFWRNTASRYGLTPEEFSLRGVQVPEHPEPEELDRLTREDPVRLKELMLEAMDHSLRHEGLAAAQDAVSVDGARVLFFACVFWSGPIASLGPAAAEYGATVINPFASAITYAEHLLASKV